MLRVLCRGSLHSQVGSICKSATGLRWSSGTSRVVELLTNEDFEKNVTNPEDKRLSVVDFTATWCPPCKTIEPVYKSLSQTFSDVNFFKVDINNEGIYKAVMDNEVSAVPYFAFFKEGSRLAHFSGADVAALKQYLEELR